MRPTVLVVEDNPVTRKFVRAVLAAEAIDVLEAASGEAALALTASRVPDLILQDLTLHDCDGFELLHRLRDRAPNAPVIAFTGLADESRILAAGFAGCLTKPVEPDRLLHAVRGLLAPAPSPMIALPRTTTHDRAWHVMRTTLERLTEIAGLAWSVERTLRSVLESMLDASGFSMGFGCTIARDGAWRVCAELALGDTLAAELAARWQGTHGARLASGEPLELSRRDGDALAGLPSIASALVIPLIDAEHPVGLLVLASRNELHRDWPQLARLLAGPLAHAVGRARAATRLAASESKFRGIAESIADGILLSDEDGTVTYVNASAAAILGRPVHDLVGGRIDEALPLIGEGRLTGNITHGDEVRPVAISLRTFEDPPEHVNCVYLLRDLSEQVRLATFSQLANTDALTGIANRRRFDEELRTRLACARRYGNEVALLLIDLDRFKPINDEHGHAAGDAVLIAVARTLAAHVRESDVVARLGGDEFAVLLEHTSQGGARDCAAKLQVLLSRLEVPFGDASLTVGASIGIAAFPAHAGTPTHLLEAADRALYRAKRGGRRRVATMEPRVPRGTPGGATLRGSPDEHGAPGALVGWSGDAAIDPARHPPDAPRPVAQPDARPLVSRPEPKRG